MITYIENTEVFSPQHLGAMDILMFENRIVQMGKVDHRALTQVGLDINHINGKGTFAWPGLIDPHEHLIGGSGESGFGSQSPEVTIGEILEGGITTVVGCLGVDTITKTMPALVGKAKALNAQGLTAFAYSGGYEVPGSTITKSIREDILFIDEIIGAGEVAICDERSNEPSLESLAALVSDVHVAGLLSKKAAASQIW